jgi:hypothetical protein
LLGCCNALYNASFSYVLFSSKDSYRRLEFGICPQCGCLKFKDFNIDYNGVETIHQSTGKHALQKLEQWRKRIRNTRYGSKSNQNVYYGDFKKTSKTDDNGLPIYQQLRKNFNGQSEVIGEIETKLLSMV